MLISASTSLFATLPVYTFLLGSPKRIISSFAAFQIASCSTKYSKKSVRREVELPVLSKKWAYCANTVCPLLPDGLHGWYATTTQVRTSPFPKRVQVQGPNLVSYVPMLMICPTIFPKAMAAVPPYFPLICFGSVVLYPALQRLCCPSAKIFSNFCSSSVNRKFVRYSAPRMISTSNCLHNWLIAATISFDLRNIMVL